MTFGRSYDFERETASSLASEVEKSLKAHLNNQNVLPTSSAYYLDQIKSSIESSSPGIKKLTTVSDMVDDLRMRTGLTKYLEEIKASEELTTKTAQSTQTVSFLNVPDFKKALEQYIDGMNAFQFAPILNILEQIKTQAEGENKLPQELIQLDPKQDKQLLEFIKARIAAKANNEIDNTNIYMPSNDNHHTSMEEDLTWAKG